jgi:undecaprenyl-diphosphatase
MIGICTILRLFYSQLLLLTPDEANYWQWSRHLDWSYHDQTPLIGWAIRLATSVFGHNALSVRLPSILSMAIASTYLVLIARQWFSDRVAWHTAIVIQSVLIFNVGGILATADGMQGACWAAVCFHIACALDNKTWRSWLLGGIWLGIGLLSKYTMVLLPACIVLFVAFSNEHRKVLTSVKPYIACLLGLLIFSPVIAWNAGNNWNSFRHVAHLGGADQAFGLHLNFFLEFLGSQAGLLSPLVFILLVLGWIRSARRFFSNDHWIHTFLLFTSFPFFITFCLLSLHTRVYANWPGAAYLTALVSATVYWALDRKPHHGKFRVNRIWGWTLGTSAALTLIVLLQVVWPIVPISVQHDRSAHEVIGWDVLGQKVFELASEMPKDNMTFIYGLSYQDASQLAFYTPGQPFTVAINRWNRPNVYDYWWKDTDLFGQNGVGVIRDGGSRARLLEVFERVDTPIPLPIFRKTPWDREHSKENRVRIFYLYRCYGFKGGLRWEPKDQRDIRVSMSSSSLIK